MGWGEAGLFQAFTGGGAFALFHGSMSQLPPTTPDSPQADAATAPVAAPSFEVIVHAFGRRIVILSLGYAPLPWSPLW